MTNTSTDNPFARSRLPMYAQIAALIRQRIGAGEWAIGERLPTLEALEVEYGVARVTVRQAVALLEDEGLVWRKQGKGTFITRRPRGREQLPLATNWDNVMQMIEGTTMKLVSTDIVDSPPHLVAQDGLAAAGYQHIRRVHALNGEPYCVIELYVDSALYAQASEAFQTQLALQVLTSTLHIPIKTARQTLTIGSADVATATFLDLEIGAPTAEVRRVITDVHNTVIYFADITYRGDFVKFDIDLLSNGGSTTPDGK